MAYTLPHPRQRCLTCLAPCTNKAFLLVPLNHASNSVLTFLYDIATYFHCFGIKSTTFLQYYSNVIATYFVTNNLQFHGLSVTS